MVGRSPAPLSRLLPVCGPVLILLSLAPALAQVPDPARLAVRGIHFSAPRSDDVRTFADFIRGPLKTEGVNLLVLEINYAFQYASHPELATENALSREQLEEIVLACRESGIELVPMFNCLGHQSWSTNTSPLLRHYPEFDETPGQYPNNEGIYCRSYCPLHPDVHNVIFALIGELLSVSQSTSFHVGMDEVFLLAEDSCPRCRGNSPAVLFAAEVNRLHAFLQGKGVRMWMWGDRFLDGVVTGIGKWEASTNGTAPSIDLVPRDIVICDWHYEYSPPTAAYFAVKGFSTVSSPWRKEEVALSQLDQMLQLQRGGTEEIEGRALGILQTTWTGPARFMSAYAGDFENASESARESSDCFKRLFREMRERGLVP